MKKKKYIKPTVSKFDLSKEDRFMGNYCKDSGYNEGNVDLGYCSGGTACLENSGVS